MKKISITICDLKPNNLLQVEKLRELFFSYNNEISFKGNDDQLNKIFNNFVKMVHENDKRWIILIKDNDYIFGFSIFQITDFDVNTYMYDGKAMLEHGYPEWCFIREHFIDESFRNKGYGQMLNDFIVKRIKEHSIKEIYLTSDNAIGFWENIGYQKLNKTGFNGLDVLKLEL